MRQGIVKGSQDKMTPVSMVSDINKSAAEKFITIQTEYMTDLFNAGLAQMQALSNIQEPKEVFELQIKFFKKLDAKFANFAEKEVTVLSEAKEQLMDVIENNIYSMVEVTQLMQNTQEKIEETINISAHKQNGGSNKTAPNRKNV